MSLYINSLAIRIFCATFIFTGINTLHAQVPVPGHSKFAFATEKSGITERTTNEAIAPTNVITVKSQSSTVPFGVISKALLDMKGYDPEFTRSFTFKNTSTATYTINAVDLEKQDNTFDIRAIEPGESLPMDVAPGKTFSVRIAFHAIDRNRLSSNRLIFSTEQNKEPIVYQIQAIQQPLSDMPWNKKALASHTK